MYTNMLSPCNVSMAGGQGSPAGGPGTYFYRGPSSSELRVDNNNNLLATTTLGQGLPSGSFAWLTAEDSWPTIVLDVVNLLGNAMLAMTFNSVSYRLYI